MPIAQLGLAGVVLISIELASNASSQINDQTGFFSITDDDDSFTYPWTEHTDQHYTHGIKFAGMAGYEPTTNACWFLEKTLGWGTRPEASCVGGVLGQNMYTPTVILTPAPVPTDRPYAGWLYAGPVYQREGEMSPNLFVQDSFEADLGVVGPDSLAGATQKQFHRLFFPDDIPEGWRNQIQNEPGVVLKYQRALRWSPTAAMSRYLDFLPRAGFDLGNVFTFATAGVTGRLGVNLPPDFGEATIDSAGSVNSGFTNDKRWLGAYVFGGVDGRAVGQNITLDGSWFQSDPSVTKNVWVGDLEYGFALLVSPPGRFPQLEFSFTHVERTKEFRSQVGDDRFGSVTLKINFSF